MASLRQSDVVRGWPFHNAAVESAGSPATTDEIVRTYKRDFSGRLVAVPAKPVPPIRICSASSWPCFSRVPPRWPRR
ncbi:hypothetical protein MYSE111917_21260 [Mycobacterium senriense]